MFYHKQSTYVINNVYSYSFIMQESFNKNLCIFTNRKLSVISRVNNGEESI